MRHWTTKRTSIRQPRLCIAYLMALLALFLFGARSAIAQSHVGQASPSPTDAGFAPLDRWKAAVLAGDKAAIKAFYVSDPRAFAQTPQGKIADAGGEESDFWSRLAPAGLEEIVSKILEQNSPQLGVTSLVLRVELKFQSKSESHKSVVSTAQVWVRQDDDWRIFVSQRSDAEPLPGMQLPEPKIPNTHRER